MNVRAVNLVTMILLWVNHSIKNIAKSTRNPSTLLSFQILFTGMCLLTTQNIFFEPGSEKNVYFISPI
jgi:hypothetical protein